MKAILALTTNAVFASTFELWLGREAAPAGNRMIAIPKDWTEPPAKAGGRSNRGHISEPRFATAERPTITVAAP